MSVPKASFVLHIVLVLCLLTNEIVTDLVPHNERTIVYDLLAFCSVPSMAGMRIALAGAYMSKCEANQSIHVDACQMLFIYE
jgi:hypothetical protein